MKQRMFSIGILIFAAASARAQIGIYGKFDLTNYTNRNDNTTTLLHGGGVGIYDDFLHVGPVHAGLDLRGSLQSGTNLSYRNLLVGVRVGVKPPILPIRPYIQGSVGVGGTRYTGTTAAGITNVPYERKLTYEVLGGIDLTIFPHFDFRAIELGYGQQSGVGSRSNTPATTLFLVSTGLVFRL